MPDVAATLEDLCGRLETHERTHLHLRPGPQVDALFGALVDLVLATPPDAAAAALADPVVRELQARLPDLCGRGEHALEMAWAARIAASERPEDELAGFPYLENYRRLSGMELDVLADVATGPVRRVGFVGAGPLPLTSLLWGEELGVPVVNVDRDPAALAAGREVARALGARDQHFVLADAEEADLSHCDVVVLAALVGATTDDKRRIVRRLASRMAPGAVLLARSARGLRTLLYPPVDLRALDPFDLQAVVHPSHDVINSVVLARAPGPEREA
jgi:nicotianamine synthase